MELYKIGQEG